MIPFYKAFSLFMRVFSRPLIAYTKKYHANNNTKSVYVRATFIKLGNFYHKVESQINRKFLKIHSEFAFKPLNDELAIERGIQFFYQIIFYSIVIGLPVYEMYRASQQSSEKNKDIDCKLKQIQQKSDEVLLQLDKIAKKMIENDREERQFLRTFLTEQESNEWLLNLKHSKSKEHRMLDNIKGMWKKYGKYDKFGTYGNACYELTVKYGARRSIRHRMCYL